MTVPKYQELLLPLLEVLADGDEFSIRDVVTTLADRLALSSDDLSITVPTGKQSLFDNRARWARTYLAKAGLIDAPQRGRIRITPAGLALLRQRPEEITKTTLMAFEAFRDFYLRSGERPLPAP